MNEAQDQVSSVDADGVALAAIQGLNRKLATEVERRDAENAELRKILGDLKAMVEELAKHRSKK